MHAEFVWEQVSVIGELGKLASGSSLAQEIQLRRVVLFAFSGPSSDNSAGVWPGPMLRTAAL